MKDLKDETLESMTPSRKSSEAYRAENKNLSITKIMSCENNQIIEDMGENFEGTCSENFEEDEMIVKDVIN